MRVLPPGFRAVAALGGMVALLGVLQLLSLFARDEAYPISAAALAILLLCGGGVVSLFVVRNVRRGVASDEAGARSEPGDWLTAAALSVICAEAIYLAGSTSIFFPFRMALFWRGTIAVERLAEPALPMMLAGTCLVGLGALATAALCGAVWTWLYARGLLKGRGAATMLSFASAVPYVAFALVVRALVCRPVAFLAAGEFLALRPDDALGYRSLLGAAPGLLAASLATGLAVGRGLWSWLDTVRASEESSESFLTATVRGELAWEIVLRQGLWLRRRRELGALLLGGMAAACLVDVLSNALIDSFRGAGFPPYPSLGAALFLRGLTPDGAPAPLPAAWSLAHAAVMLAALLLVLAQAVPVRPRRISLHGGVLRVDARVLAGGVASAHGLPPRPSIQWVLGDSGAGKSVLLKAWAAQLSKAVLVPQDPDDALPGPLAATDLARLGGPRRDRMLWDLLGRLDDRRTQRRLLDPFTPCSSFSRGERQRLLVCVALSRVLSEPDCTLLIDEPTSAQDGGRTRALLDCIRDLLPAGFTGSGSVVITTHDVEPIAALLGDRAGQAIDDHVLWLEGGKAAAFSVGERWTGEAAQPADLQRYLGAVDRLLSARHCEEGPASAGSGGVGVLGGTLLISGRTWRVSADARVHSGELTVLSGPSGSGKTTLLREICRNGPALVRVGYVAQDTARAFPPQMQVAEVLGPRIDLVRRWFGADLPPSMLRRSVGALSEGERQRVVLAAEVSRLEQLPARTALRLLLLDEPFGALDPPAHLRLMDALSSWIRAAPGRAAVMVSHSPQMDLGLAGASGVPATEWIMGGEIA